MKRRSKVSGEEGTHPPTIPASVPRGLVFDEAAQDAIDIHVGSDTRVEKGGVLVGSVDETTGNVTIVAAIPAHMATSAPASLTFTHEAWDEVNEVLAHDFPEHRMVGWYHSHPLFGIFLSEYDMFIQTNFFSAPWQVAFVVDPILGQSGFFGWEDGKIVRLDSWIVLAHGSAKSVREPERGSNQAPLPPTKRQVVPRHFVRVIAGLIVAALVGALIAHTLQSPSGSAPTPTNAINSSPGHYVASGIYVSRTETHVGTMVIFTVTVYNARSHTVTGSVSNCAPSWTVATGESRLPLNGDLGPTTHPRGAPQPLACNLQAGIVSGGVATFTFDGSPKSAAHKFSVIPTPKYTG